MTVDPQSPKRQFRPVFLDGVWKVEVTDPGTTRWYVSGFESETAAWQWIAQAQVKRPSAPDERGD